jgi:hypothetical protein
VDAAALPALLPRAMHGPQACAPGRTSRARVGAGGALTLAMPADRGAAGTPSHVLDLEGGSDNTERTLALAAVGPGRHYSPHYRMSFESRNEGSKCESMTWRATSARPYAVVTRRAAVLAPVSMAGPAKALERQGLANRFLTNWLFIVHLYSTAAAALLVPSLVARRALVHGCCRRCRALC